MGFWSTLGNIASSATEAIKKNNEEINQLKREYEQKSDSELKEIATSSGLFGSSSKEKIAACAVLKGRGYSSLNDV